MSRTTAELMFFEERSSYHPDGSKLSNHFPLIISQLLCERLLMQVFQLVCYSYNVRLLVCLQLCTENFTPVIQLTDLLQKMFALCCKIRVYFFLLSALEGMGIT